MKTSYTIMKIRYRKLKPKIINYRKYKTFSNDIFRDSLLEQLSEVRINNDDDGFNKFLRNCWNTLDRFASRKKSALEVIMHRLWIKLLVRRLWGGQI